MRLFCESNQQTSRTICLPPTGTLNNLHAVQCFLKNQNLAKPSLILTELTKLITGKALSGGQIKIREIIMFVELCTYMKHIHAMEIVLEKNVGVKCEVYAPLYIVSLASS